MKKVLVYHRGYGCETGCCGHAVSVDDKEVGFNFHHPDDKEDFKEWAKDLVTQECGEDHVADLDWENCEVKDFMSC
jgi:hypothetical protein